MLNIVISEPGQEKEPANHRPKYRLMHLQPATSYAKKLPKALLSENCRCVISKEIYTRRIIDLLNQNFRNINIFIKVLFLTDFRAPWYKLYLDELLINNGTKLSLMLDLQEEKEPSHDYSNASNIDEMMIIFETIYTNA